MKHLAILREIVYNKGESAQNMQFVQQIVPNPAVQPQYIANRKALSYMMWSNLSKSELKTLRDQAAAELEAARQQNLKLDLTRGKPSRAQLDLSTGMLGVIAGAEDCVSDGGLDCRNYGVLDGIDECKELMADMMEVRPDQVIILSLIHI